MRRSVHTAWLVVAALLLAGCASSVIGTGRPDPDVSAELQRQRELEDAPLIAEEALGDFTTIDYCSLVDVGVLGEAMVVDGPPLPSFDYCDIAATTQGEPVWVQIGNLFEPGYLGGVPDLDKELPRGLTLERVPAQPGECWVYLVFADAYRLESVAEAESTDPPSDLSEEQLCLVAEKALDSVVAVLTEPGAVVHHLTYAEDSLGALDACGDTPAFLESPQVASVLGVSSVEMAGFPAGHECQWMSRGERVSLFFYVGAPEPSSQSAPETIAGRQTHVFYGEDFCMVETPHVPFAEASDGTEIAAIYVEGASGKELCAVGRKLAELAWPKLPPL